MLTAYTQQFTGGSRISDAFLSLSPVLPSLTDRLGDAKDQVRDQAQTLLLKIMDQAANPQVCTHVPANQFVQISQSLTLSS